MTALLLTVLALILPLIVYATYRVLGSIPPVSSYAEEPPEIDASPFGIDSDDSRQVILVAVPATDPHGARMQVSRRGNRTVQQPLPATGRPILAAPTIEDVDSDDTTHITPHERRMLDFMTTASSEQFQTFRQLAKQFEGPGENAAPAAQCHGTAAALTRHGIMLKIQSLSSTFQF
ncbi:hypothetical protein DFH06DRAFT_1325992 [Mycena polygramma]|nr:hypothetical protein DFH06DRAFT_1325992 [Mycena polygramma]